MAKHLFLSRIELKKDASVAALLPLLLSKGSGHGAQDTGHNLVWSLFADSSERKRDFLWRENSPGSFLLLSSRTPIDHHGLFRVDEPKEFAPVLSRGDPLRFTLRANPVIRRKTKKNGRSVKHDVVMDELREMPEGSRSEKRLIAVRERGYQWLNHQAEKSGFIVDKKHVMVDSYRQHRIRKSGEKASTVIFSSLDYDGILTVSDPDLFLTSISKGFGSSKAYGCGLMLIRRA